MKKLGAILLLLIFPKITLAGNVWVPPKGTLHFAPSLTIAQWDQFLQTGNSPVELPGDVTQYEFSLFGEYTPIENLSFDLQLPIVFVQKKFVFLQTDGMGNITGVQTGPNGEVRDVGTNAGIGDVVMGSRYIFLDEPLTLGARAHLKIPGTYKSGDVPNAPGDGQVDLGLAFLAGASVPQIHSYFRGSLGYVIRAGAPANQMEVMLEPGVNITHNLSARLIYQWTHQFGGDDILFYGLTNYYPANQEDSHRIGLGLSYQANENLGFFGLYSQTFAGRNTANTKAITFGIDLSF